MARTKSREQLDHAIERVQSQFSGEISFAAKNLVTGEEILIDADGIYPTASTIKLAILAELYRQSHHKALDLQARTEVTESDIVGGSGVLKALGPQLRPTIYDLATLMVIVSDNTATNMLIDRLGGTDVVNNTMRSYGLNTIVLHNRVDFALIGDDIRRFAEASAADLMRFNELLLRGEMVDAAASRAMIDIMQKQQYLDQVPRYFNLRHSSARELYLNQQIEVGCKTGFFPGTRVDAGFIVLPSVVRIVYCAMAHRSNDLSIAPESEAAVVNGLLGRLMLDYWWPDKGTASEAVLPSRYVDDAVGKS